MSASTTELQMLRIYFMGVRGMGDGYHAAFDITKVVPKRRDGSRTMFIPYLCRAVRADAAALRNAPEIPFSVQRCRRMIRDRVRQCRKYAIEFNRPQTKLVLAVLGGGHDRALEAPKVDRSHVAVQRRKEAALVEKARTFQKYRPGKVERVTQAQPQRGQLALAL